MVVMKFQEILKIIEMQFLVYNRPILRSKMVMIALGLNSGYCKERVNHINNLAGQLISIVNCPIIQNKINNYEDL